MNTDPAALKALILSQPDGSPVRAAFAAGNDTETARLLNVPTQRGYVTITELASYCCTHGITGGVLTLLEIPLGLEIAPGLPMTVQIKGMLHTVLTLVQVDFRLTLVDVDLPQFQGACDGLIQLGVMTREQKAAILALGANRQSVAESALGGPVTQEDIGKARQQ